MDGFLVIPESLDRRIEKDLDELRDSLPEGEREIFEAERKVHRQTIIDHLADYGSYPDIAGVEKTGDKPPPQTA